jgi:hypothetical protein
MEEMLIDTPCFRRFAGIDMVSDRVLDETTILNFRHGGILRNYYHGFWDPTLLRERGINHDHQLQWQAGGPNKLAVGACASRAGGSFARKTPPTPKPAVSPHPLPPFFSTE